MKYAPLRNHIGGTFVEPGGEQQDVVSPLDGSLLSRVPLSGAVEVEAAAEAGPASVRRLERPHDQGAGRRVLRLSCAAGAARR
jgi:acyl-CoA reductase-like NAD-dependent aldehyde dehydrogenase